jgi:hypothetical protein
VRGTRVRASQDPPPKKKMKAKRTVTVEPKLPVWPRETPCANTAILEVEFLRPVCGGLSPCSLLDLQRLYVGPGGEAGRARLLYDHEQCRGHATKSQVATCGCFSRPFPRFRKKKYSLTIVRIVLRRVSENKNDKRIISVTSFGLGFFPVLAGSRMRMSRQ